MKCAICGYKISKFIKKKQEAKRLLSNLGIRTHLSKSLASMVYKFFDKKTAGSGEKSTP